MNLVTGIDLLEVGRLQAAIESHGDRFLQRIFTPLELETLKGRADSLAGRFAAKEAVAKALGRGIGDMQWKEIEILRAERGEPVLSLHGSAKEIADSMGLKEWRISISHTKDVAVAVAIGIGE